MYPKLPVLSPRPPYRLGTTSYTYPEDLLTNVRRLAGQVDDVELVLFDTRQASNIPSAGEVEELAAIARPAGMTFTVHFPVEHRLGDANPAVRQRFIAQAKHLIALTRPLPVHAWILHLEGIRPDDGPERVQQWQQDCTAGVREILQTGIAPEMLVVENLSAPFAWHEPVMDAFGLAICTDIGHLWRAKQDPIAHLHRYLPRTRVIHFHGEHGGRDHISLAHVEPQRLQPVLDALQSYREVLSLELFDFAEIAESIRLLH